MANICCNSMKIIGDKKRLMELKESLDKCLENGICSFRKVAEVLKVEIPDEVYCRGEISYVDEVVDNILTMQTETAWRPMDEYWDIVTEKLELKYVSLSEECGVGVYVLHNDPEGQYFPENYVIDIWEAYQDLSSDYYYFETEKEICEFMQESVPEQEFKSFEDIRTYFDDVDFGVAHQYVRD